jgi:hypothetical protein
MVALADRYTCDKLRETKLMNTRRAMTVLLVGAMLVLATSSALADKPIDVDENGIEIKWAKSGCTTIQSGELYASTGEVLTTGFDKYGYNYQAHQYIGYYGNYRRPPEPVDWGYRLAMKWNDAWLANVDCDDDGLLDRHHGFDSYIGSGAWLTNHQKGEDTVDGEVCKWEYFVKIVAAPADAYTDGGVWYAADGTEIGPVIWGAFAIIQSVYDDSCGGGHGLDYVSPDHAGLGGW